MMVLAGNGNVVNLRGAEDWFNGVFVTFVMLFVALVALLAILWWRARRSDKPHS